MAQTKTTTIALGASLKCDPSLISHIRSGNSTPSLRIAAGIERLTSSWAEGPIRPAEWVPRTERVA